MDRGAWLGYSPWGPKELDMTELLTLSLFCIFIPKTLVSGLIIRSKATPLSFLVKRKTQSFGGFVLM